MGGGNAVGACHAYTRGEGKTEVTSTKQSKEQLQIKSKSTRESSETSWWPLCQGVPRTTPGHTVRL